MNAAWLPCIENQKRKGPPPDWSVLVAIIFSMLKLLLSTKVSRVRKVTLFRIADVGCSDALIFH